MKATITETRFLIYSVGAIFLLMLVHIFQPQLNKYYNPEYYVVIHTFLEILCITISAIIFVYGYKKFQATKSNRVILLSVAFLMVGLIDLLHTLSYKGMPIFITESSVTKATWFWVVGRVLQSLLMLSLILLPERKLKRDYLNVFLLLGLILTGIIGFLIISFESNLPLLVIEGKGTTLLKNGIEYFVSLILFISLIISLYHYYLDKREEQLYFALGFVLLLLTELIFTIYQSVFDLDNFVGHLFKVFGFYFLFKGFYFSKFSSELVQTNFRDRRISQMTLKEDNVI